MREDFNIDEKELDACMEGLNKEEISVPVDLEERIRRRIHSIKPKRHLARNSIAACICLCLLFAGGVKFNAGFAAYAASIPGLKGTVEWLRGDRGIQNARDHGYKGIQDIEIKENGYELYFSDIILDEDRLRFVVQASGDKFENLINGKTAEGETLVETSDEKTPQKNHTHVNLFLPDFDQMSFGTVSVEIRDNCIVPQECEITFKNGELAKYLEKLPDYMNMEVKIVSYNEMDIRGKSVYTFSPVKISFGPSDIMFSKYHVQDLQLSYEHAVISINQFCISPTRMRLDFHFAMEDGYAFSRFENPYLKDDKGNIYKSEGLAMRSSSPEEKSLYFVPSVYFDDEPQNLYFCCDGIRIASEEGRSFIIRLDDEFPKKIKYMGQEIIIKKAYWDDRNGFNIWGVFPDKNILEIFDFNIKDNGGMVSRRDNNRDFKDEKGNIETVRMINFDHSQKRDEYEVWLESPGYFIPGERSYELNME